MSDPLTFADARTLKQQGDLGRFIKHHMAEAERAAAHRRGLVLRYPDIAAKLTEPPIGFTSPEKWNGYIPPATDCTGAMNTARCRPALLALVAEAERRLHQPQEVAEAIEEAA
ncbi:hypothetical protein [Streptomyces massasporeus]|uniref:hypothetical protein n=1 Tax=Streptomyces massasporeus TaxID=67324 RepID=UPI001673AD0D|nr:hypothetical protein [Streptomyces massasporeus]GGV91958.1 hypothetical protein GCM10010228_83310 [Streptomyces massasporeus]